MQRIRSNPRVPLIIGASAAIAIVVALLLWARSPDYRVLFSNLSDSDGGTIIAQLDQMQVPYRLSEGGGAIMVPADRVEQTRMQLAQQGLPDSGGVGFELMDSQSFGISQFAEQINYQRALEGELVRSIESLEAVRSARVHLALPEDSVFVRERREPSASVVLNLYRNRSVSDGQVSAITHLVAASVTNMPVDGVTVVDQNGDLLTNNEDNGPGQLSSSQLEYTHQIEEAYSRRIEQLLGTIVGADNVRAQVNAQLDFSVSEVTREMYEPNSGDNPAAIRSVQQSDSEQVGASGIGGVPGALSNQPPGDAVAPIDNPQQAEVDGEEGPVDEEAVDAAEQVATANQMVVPRSSNSSSTTNYEVNRVIRHTQEESGVLQRLSVAVVVDYAQNTDAEGNIEQVPLSDEQMAQLRSLIRESVGLSDARGDSLEVVNAAFNQTVGEAAPEIAWYRDRDLIALATTLAQYLLIALIALFLWRKVVKPLIERQQPAPQQAARTQGSLMASVGDDDDDDGEEDEDDIAHEVRKKQKQHQRHQQETMLKSIRDQAQKDPRMVALILRGWINGKD
nr:flagellar basal-body MS-ring/collar protein FliF [Kushneria aurantia]